GRGRALRRRLRDAGRNAISGQKAAGRAHEAAVRAAVQRRRPGQNGRAHHQKPQAQKPGRGRRLAVAGPARARALPRPNRRYSRPAAARAAASRCFFSAYARVACRCPCPRRHSARRARTRGHRFLPPLRARPRPSPGDGTHRFSVLRIVAAGAAQRRGRHQPPGPRILRPAGRCLPRARVAPLAHALPLGPAQRPASPRRLDQS
nr:hypothetical protein [Tanacetum cinerariifolium]